MVSGPLILIGGIVVTAISYPFYLHHLGFERYGLWIILSSVITFSQIGNLGVAQALARYVARAFADGHRAEVVELYTSGCYIVGFSGCLLFILLLFFRPSIIAFLHLSPSLAGIALYLLPWTVALSIYSYFLDLSYNMLIGLGRLDLSYGFQLVGQVLTLLVSAGLLLAGAGVLGVLIGTFAGSLVAHVLSIQAGCRLTGMPYLRFSLPRRKHLRELMGFGGWLFAGSSLNMLVAPITRLIIARCLGLTAVPIFDFAYTSSLRLRGILESGQRSLMAEAASAQNDPSARIRTLVPSAIRFLAPSGAVFLAIGVSAPFLLRTWLGSAFDVSMVPSLRIMLAGAFAGLLSSSSYYVLIGIGCAQAIFAAHALQSIVNALAIAVVLLAASHPNVAEICVASTIGMVAGAAFLIWRERHAVNLLCGASEVAA
jgi:O-antigen/teichoic acid export membrane protein